MKRIAARKISVMLAFCAGIFAAVMKPLFHSPEIPEELRK
ncbi:MAG: hypothetical protein K0R57_2517 [Paenibacillaceae bacterium]|jgi:hypothetical protein|nr:hypothetical protein [Paenibacillaceae bacterium]